MGRQTEQTMRGAGSDGERLDYLLYLPESYDETPDIRWPLILFLHGAGERGSNVWDVTREGLPRLLERRDDFPFIVVSPQCPRNAYWMVDTLATLLDDVEAQYRVDPDRIYVTGLSMGGFGTWAMAIAEPERFAAVAPICGGGQPWQVGRIRNVPVWTFHGAKDNIVPIYRTEEMVEALREAGGDVRYTVYPDAGHDSWTPAYNTPDLYDWFLARTRRERS